ncbi:nuclear transport factor 2 family protein [Actinomycetospora soli]|uniref:nuclear transport factor 2 family protein n=1 Tax=Actinomycetospora soli TaxID=2893887 RepID=UPI001E4F86F9|nr:nuclear transport factor 2 family protein [Actinomycetospora soli]MCD2185681.1 nuclear transport factor 2 family protein [Actinomycetospora soli]
MRAHRTMDRLLEAVLAHDMAAFAREWAPDGTVDFPFAPPGGVTHLEGRDAVTAHLQGYTDVVLPRRVVSDVRHDTADPDTLVVEFAVAGDVVATGEPYEMRYVAVVTVGDAGIASYRDYWNPQAFPTTGAGGPTW